MRGHWIFVLLCLSFVGELVFGSLFPTIPPNAQNAPQPDFEPPQPEVEWPLNNIATPEVIVVREATLNTRGLHMEQTARDLPLETGLKPEETLPKVADIGTEQRPVGEIVTRYNTELENKNLPLTNN